MERLQHGDHLGPQPIAPEPAIPVGAVLPDRHLQLPAEPPGVLPAEGQQGPHQPDWLPSVAIPGAVPFLVLLWNRLFIIVTLPI